MSEYLWGLYSGVKGAWGGRSMHTYNFCIRFDHLYKFCEGDLVQNLILGTVPVLCAQNSWKNTHAHCQIVTAFFCITLMY